MFCNAEKQIKTDLGSQCVDVVKMSAQCADQNVREVISRLGAALNIWALTLQSDFVL